MTEPQDFIPIRHILKGHPLELHLARGTSRRLVVCFTGVGTVRKGHPPLEFVGTALDGGKNHVIFVTDSSRSWFNAPGLADCVTAAVEQYKALVEIDEVIALGNSMGGFSALILPRLTKIDRVVAFAPQYSHHPDLMPEETRWMFFRKRIKDWQFPSIEPLPDENTFSFIFHGDTAEEVAHWKKFPTAKNVDHHILCGRDHNLVKSLHREGKLTPIVNAAMNGKKRQVRKMIEAEGGQRRDYLENMAKA